MTAGLNLRILIHRQGTGDDDDVGGAQITGSIVGYYSARMQSAFASQVFFQQGLETERLFTLTMAPGTVDVRERDEIEVVAPTDHVYYGDKFRVKGVRHSDLNPRDPRNYMILDVSRSVRAHDSQ